MPTASDVILEASGIEKSFPGVRALDGVSLRARRGRLLALLGENGAGKSTLMNILAGVFPPDAGTLRLDGREVSFPHPRAALAAGIGIVFQELNLIPHLSVAENIFLGREPRTRAGLIDYRGLNAAATAVLRRLDLRVEPTALIADLRVGQQQLVEIARAVSEEARVLILDEPTSSLSAHEVEVLFGVIAELKSRGVALVYITHKFEELAAIGDDVIVLRDGRVVGEAPLADLARDALVRLMAGRESREVFQKTAAAPGAGSISELSPLANVAGVVDPGLPAVTLAKAGPASARPATRRQLGDALPGAELLRAEALALPGDGAGRPFLVEKVSLTLHRGEVLGIFGLIGAGRTELLETIFGLHAGRASGRLAIDGRPVAFGAPADAIAAGLAFAPEDRKRDGLVLPLSVAANASLASLDRTLRAGFVSPAREAAHVAPYLDRFRVKTPSLTQPVIHLSGGNQQKVVLAKWLATAPKILLLDEPTRGIDVNAKREIYAFIDELASLGLGLIVVSSELPEILALADRVLVLCEGRATAEFTRTEATAEKILAAALPDKAVAAA